MQGVVGKVERALRDAGDPGGAAIWRQVCRDLAGETRVAVLARDDGAAARVARSLSEVDATVVCVPMDGDDDGIGGVEDQLMGAHMLLWVTPLTAPLGAEERHMLAALEDTGAPRRRAVVLADLHLLERLSDDPVREATDVRERVEALLPDGWTTLDGAGVEGWIAASRQDRRELLAARRLEVAQRLLRDGVNRLGRDIAGEEGSVAELDLLLQREDSVLQDAERAARRTAAHLLSAVRRHTEELLVDLRGFLNTFEQELPAQILAVQDIGVVRRTLPHWLRRVVEDWMGHRLAAWRAGVVADLQEVGVDATQAASAELLVPSLQPSIVRDNGGWGARLGATATLGGGVAMLFMGLWVPALVAVSSGLLWGAIGQRARDAKSREALVETAVSGVRQLGRDADGLLRDQLVHLETELDRLEEERSRALLEERGEARARLVARREARVARASELREVREVLERRLRSLDE